MTLSDLIGRQFLCRFGRHTPPCGYGVDACGRDCGFIHNPAAMRRWLVTLRSGEVFEVQGVNEYHAGSKVVFGDGVGGIQIVNGKVVPPPMKIHRDNIDRVQLVA